MIMTAPDFKDYYQILSISKDASADDIKIAYYKLARQYHPDLNPGDSSAENYLKEINEAQEVLSDPEKRRKYDLYYQYWQQKGVSNPITNEIDSDSNSNPVGQYGNFGDFFHNVLNRMGFAKGYKIAEEQTFFYNGTKDNLGRWKGMQPEDSEGFIPLTFSEAFRGTTQTIRIDDEIVEVHIPAGAKNNSFLKIKGKGKLNSLLEKRGDFYLSIKLQPHSFFEFEGDNLVAEIPITPEESVLGAEITVPTPDGQVSLQIPPRVNSGQCLKLPEKGWYHANQQRSDLMIKLQIVTPDYLSEIEQEYYQKIQEVSNFDPRYDLKHIEL